MKGNQEVVANLASYFMKVHEHSWELFIWYPKHFFQRNYDLVLVGTCSVGFSRISSSGKAGCDLG